MQEVTQCLLDVKTHGEIFSRIISWVDPQTMMECRLVDHSIKKIVDNFFENKSVSLFKQEIYASEKFNSKISLSLYEVIAYLFQEQVLKEKTIMYDERGFYISFMQFLNEEATDRMLQGEGWLANPQQLQENYANTNAHFPQLSPIKEALKISHEWDQFQQASAQEILNEIVVLELEKGEYLHAFKIAKIMIRSQYSIRMETLGMIYEKLNLFSPKFFAYADACWKQKNAVRALFQDVSFDPNKCNGLNLTIVKLLAGSCQKYQVKLDEKTQASFFKSSFTHPRQIKFASWKMLVQMKEASQVIQPILIEVMGGLAKQKEYKVIFSILLAISQKEEFNLVAFEKHLQELQLDDGALIESLKEILGWLYCQTNKKPAIKVLKNFLEFLPRKIDQLNFQKLLRSPNFFSLLTAITMVFDRVHINQFPHLENIYLIGHLAKAIQEQGAVLSEVLQKKIIHDLNSLCFGMHSILRPENEWIGQAIQEWEEETKDVSKIFLSFFTGLIEQSICWPILDIYSALYKANHTCLHSELPHLISMMIKSTLNLPSEQLFADQAARRLLQNFKTLPASAYSLALETLSSIVKAALIEEKARNIEDSNHRVSYQLLRLLDAYNLPLHGKLQKKWLLNEISKENFDWLTNCKMVLLPKGIGEYNGLESHDVDVRYVRSFDRVLLDLMMKCIDNSSNFKDPERRLGCMIRLFCIADRMGLVSSNTWDCVKKEIQKICESKPELRFLFFMFSISRPRELLEDLKALLFDLPDLQRGYIGGLVHLLATHGEEEEKQWVSEMIKIVKREISTSENYIDEFLHSSGPCHELMGWLSKLEEYLPRQNGVPTMREITDRFKEMAQRKRDLNVKDFVVVRRPTEKEDVDWELAAALKASIQDGQVEKKGEGEGEGKPIREDEEKGGGDEVVDEVVDIELYDPDLAEALRISLQEF